ncbi:MAG: hypothetical protein IAE89_00775 [Anaerolineae bacterium]|nr:hypothetical protein [Anaerolineae bacterium]
MSTRDFHDILNDCIERMAAGQSLEVCLRLYPDDAERLRPLLEAGAQTRHLLAERAEISADQALVWGRIGPQLARQRLNRRRKPGIGRLLLAAVLLLGLLGGAWLALNRPQQQPDLIEPLPTTMTPTNTYTASPSATFTAAPTASPTPTPVPASSSTPFPTLLPPTVALPATQFDDDGADDDSPDDDGERNDSDGDSEDH